MSRTNVQVPTGYGADNFLTGTGRRLDPHAKQVCAERGEAHVLAANEHVRAAERDADEWEEEHGPLWLGWALHRAFLAGVAWAERKP